MSQPADRRSAKKRSGRAMPVTTNTREFDGTTTESRAPATCRGAPIARVTRNTGATPKRAADALGRGVVAGGDQRRVGGARRVERLAQPAGRQRPILQIVVGDQQQIDVARQLEMLKAVVEQVDGGAELVLGEAAGEIAIGADQHRHAGQRARQHQRLVAGASRPARTRVPSETTVTPSRAIAAAVAAASGSRGARRRRAAAARCARRPASCRCRRRAGCRR